FVPPKQARFPGWLPFRSLHYTPGPPQLAIAVGEIAGCAWASIPVGRSWGFEGYDHGRLLRQPSARVYLNGPSSTACPKYGRKVIGRLNLYVLTLTIQHSGCLWSRPAENRMDLTPRLVKPASSSTNGSFCLDHA